MQSEEQIVSEMMRRGTYFKEARAWYQAIYINIIPERAFFLLVGLIAGLTGFFGFVAFTDLMPLVDRPPIVIYAKDIAEDVPYLTRVRQSREPLNEAMTRFFILSYVSNRESYNAADAAVSQAFVAAHSDPSTLNSYLPTVNPQTLRAQLGESGEREVLLQDYALNTKVEPPIATVLFTTTDKVNGQAVQSHWRVTIGFYYTPMIVKEGVDKQYGTAIIETEDPQFQVVNYVREKLP